MNSALTFAVLCISVISLSTSVQCRPSSQWALKRDEGNGFFCELIISVVEGAIVDADLHLTSEQEALLSQQHHKRTSENGQDELCEEEVNAWIESRKPFFESLSEAQLEKLIRIMYKLADDSEQVQRALAFTQTLLKRTVANQRKRHFHDESDDQKRFF